MASESDLDESLHTVLQGVGHRLKEEEEEHRQDAANAHEYDPEAYLSRLSAATLAVFGTRSMRAVLARSSMSAADFNLRFSFVPDLDGARILHIRTYLTRKGELDGYHLADIGLEAKMHRDGIHLHDDGFYSYVASDRGLRFLNEIAEHHWGVTFRGILPSLLLVLLEEVLRRRWASDASPLHIWAVDEEAEELIDYYQRVLGVRRRARKNGGEVYLDAPQARFAMRTMRSHATWYADGNTLLRCDPRYPGVGAVVPKDVVRVREANGLVATRLRPMTEAELADRPSEEVVARVRVATQHAIATSSLSQMEASLLESLRLVQEARQKRKPETELDDQRPEKMAKLEARMRML